MSFMLNSWGRTFIQESGCSNFGYSEDCLELAGITESFGDITQIYCSSDSASGEYEIVAQLEGAETAPSTTITSYLRADGVSKLRDLAKRKCVFNLHVHYGQCNNPTDFNDFDSGIIFEGVRITSYSTTNLTSRSPDSRALIDLTFNVSIKKIHYISKAKFSEVVSAASVAAGKIIDVFAYDGEDCSGADCVANCTLMALQVRGTSYYFLRNIDNTWLASSIVSGITPSSNDQAFLYTNGTTLYAFLPFSGPSTYTIYALDYADIDLSNPTWTQVYTGSGGVAGIYYVYGGHVYYGNANGTNSTFNSLNISSGAVTTLGSGIFSSSMQSVFGSGSTIYIGLSDGNLFQYKNGAFSDLNLGLSGGVKPLSIVSENSFKILENEVNIYCTTNGGQSFTDVATNAEALLVDRLNTDNPNYVLGLGKLVGVAYESFDGGLTFSQNTSLDFSDYILTSVSFCNNEIYLGAKSTNGLEGFLFKS